MRRTRTMPEPGAKGLGGRPTWITFDCDGTPARGPETLGAARGHTLAQRGAADRQAALRDDDRRREAALAIERPHRSFRDMAQRTPDEIGLAAAHEPAAATASAPPGRTGTPATLPCPTAGPTSPSRRWTA